MDLRKAMETVVKDLLMNNQGGIPEDDLKNIDVDKIVKHLTDSDIFLIQFTDMGESLIAEYFDDYGDELGI